MSWLLEVVVLVLILDESWVVDWNIEIDEVFVKGGYYYNGFYIFWVFIVYF